jgi:glycosyltransferase involved in cell wall biosynthesis
MNMGGQELRILMEMEGLVQYGFTSVLAARPGSRIVQEARTRGLQVYTLSMRGSLDPVAVARILQIIWKEKVDLVCTHGSRDGWSAGMAARILRKKTVRSRNVANPIRSHFLGRLVYTALCDLIVTTSEFIGKGMIERGVPPERIVCVPTGVDHRRFHPDVEKGLFRKDLGISGEKPLVGMISVLRGDKGPDVFLQAAELVLKVHPDAFFTLVGDGWMRGKLETALRRSPYRDNIRLTGFRKDIPFVMADLDVLVLSAKIPEGVPQTVLQAYAMKLPVIASDVGGINEVAIHGKTALLVPPNDPQALADCILTSLNDPRGMKDRAERSHRMVLEAYTLDMFLEKMTAIYGDLALERARRRAAVKTRTGAGQ